MNLQARVVGEGGGVSATSYHTFSTSTRDEPPPPASSTGLLLGVVLVVALTAAVFLYLTPATGVATNSQLPITTRAAAAAAVSPRQKLVLLLRHAQSAAVPEATMPDMKRPLTPQGEWEARCVGTYVREQQRGGVYFPDFVLCSPSVRTRQTLWQFMTGYNAGGWLSSNSSSSPTPVPVVEYIPALYSGVASKEGMLLILRRVSEAYQRVLFVGHWPALAEFTALLLPNVSSSRHHRAPHPKAAAAEAQLARQEFNTSELMVIEVGSGSGNSAGRRAVAWKDVRVHTNTFVWEVTPQTAGCKQQQKQG